MEKLNLETSTSLNLEVHVAESDSYSESMMLELSKTYKVGSPRGDRYFMTPDQMELMARYMLRKVEEVRQAQKHRLDLREKR
jgi:hypothetical protein